MNFNVLNVKSLLIMKGRKGGKDLYSKFNKKSKIIGPDRTEQETFINLRKN